MSHDNFEIHEPSTGALRDASAGAFEPSTSALTSGTSDSAPTRIASRPTAMGEDERPEQVGNYRILELLGEGGMGSVYLAEQREPVRRKVALKLVKLGMDTKEVIARFDSERQALAMMNHPNVAAVYDAGVTERGRPYFVMEFVAGVPINRFCDESRLRTRNRLELFMQVCDAVQHAHQKGIIHRDLKPSNILVMLRDGSPTPKVIDFGVAKATTNRLSDLTLHTQVGQIVGTPEYMSPEQALSSGLDVDTRTDVYSLGVVLYALLTGELPIDAKALRRSGPAEMQRLIRESQPSRPSTRITGAERNSRSIADARSEDLNTIRRHLRGDLDWVVMKAIDKDRTRRYASASELAADIRRWLAGEPVAAGPPSAAYRMRKFVSRHRGSVAAGAALLLSLVGGLTISTSLYFKAEAARLAETEQRDLAETRRVTAETARADAERERDRAVAAEAAAGKSADEARAAAARSDAVNKFMRKVLTAPDVRKSGHDVTVADALDHASAEATSGLAEQPEIRMAVHSELGKTYFSLGRYEKAIEQYEAARELVDELYHGDSDDLPRMLIQLGTSYEHIGQPEKGIELCRLGLQTAQTRFGRDHVDTLAARNQLAQLLQNAGDLQGAEKEFRSLMADTRRVLGDNHRDTVVTMNCVGWNLQTQKRLEEAESIYRECVNLAETALGPDHADTLIALANLGSVLRDRGALDEAQRVLRDVSKRIERLFGEEHPDFRSVQRNLAMALARAQKYAEAQEVRRRIIALTERVHGEGQQLIGDWLDYLQLKIQAGDAAGDEADARRALEMSRRLLGAEDRLSLLLSSVTAQILALAHKFDDSIKLYDEFLPVARRVFGEEDRDLLIMLNAKALALGDADRSDESEAMLREIIALGERLLGRENRDVLIWRFNHVHALSESGRVEAALRESAEVSELVARTCDRRDPLVASATVTHANLLLERGQLSESAAQYRAGYALRSEALGPNHRSTLQVRARLTALLLYQGAIGDATRTARKLLVARREILPAGDAEIAESLTLLGECLTHAGDLDEAERLIREGRAIRRAAQPPNEEYVARSESALGECMTARGRYDDAEQLLLRAHDVLGRDARDRLVTRLCVGRMIDLYERWGRPERAAEWRGRPNMRIPATPTTQPVSRPAPEATGAHSGAAP